MRISNQNLIEKISNNIEKYYENMKFQIIEKNNKITILLEFENRKSKIEFKNDFENSIFISKSQEIEFSEILIKIDQFHENY